MQYVCQTIKRYRFGRGLAVLPLILAALVCPPQNAQAQAPSPGEIVAQAPADAWTTIPDADLLTMTVAGGRTVTIQLVRGFAPVHVANIEKLVSARWFDGVSINRVQENYVVQWGDATEHKPLPPGLGSRPPATTTGRWKASGSARSGSRTLCAHDRPRRRLAGRERWRARLAAALFRHGRRRAQPCAGYRHRC
ncbi:peptidylprolyl isomerase [Hankyongella ginsenosidimutans]|uniref:peptidylprolyl isomerase n=1 Tax=Hankyongella ginsenosidimutans TaxID=1763828 RepID=UPI002482EF5D|nr:peptidylprolyl isomerase [Hankyongella ginsenosidimutans]